MCSRHAAHLIAVYEATRLADEETGEPSDASSMRDAEREPSERTGVLS